MALERAVEMDITKDAQFSTKLERRHWVRKRRQEVIPLEGGAMVLNQLRVHKSMDV